MAGGIPKLVAEEEVEDWVVGVLGGVVSRKVAFIGLLQSLEIKPDETKSSAVF